MRNLHLVSDEMPSTFFGSDFHIGAGAKTDQLINKAFSLFPEFRRQHGFHFTRTEILGDFVECWLIDNKPVNSYAIYGNSHVIQNARNVIGGIVDGGVIDVCSTPGNHGTRILPKDATHEEAQAEQVRAVDEMRSFMGKVLEQYNHKLDVFGSIKMTDDGVIRHHGDLEDVQNEIGNTIDVKSDQLLDRISEDTQHRLQEGWRTFNQRYIWPLLRVSPRLANMGFKGLQDISRITSVFREGGSHDRLMKERWKNPLTPWAITQLRMMQAINDNVEKPHPHPLIVSGHTHTPLIVQHPKYKGTAVSLGGWDGEIYNPVVGIRRGDRFLMAEFDLLMGKEGKWNIRDDVKIA